MHVDGIHISLLSLWVRRGIPLCFFLTETLSSLLTSIFTLRLVRKSSNYELFLDESIKTDRIKHNAQGRLTRRWCEMQMIQTHFLKVVFCNPHSGYAIALKQSAVTRCTQRPRGHFSLRSATGLHIKTKKKNVDDKKRQRKIGRYKTLLKIKSSSP